MKRNVILFYFPSKAIPLQYQRKAEFMVMHDMTQGD